MLVVSVVDLGNVIAIPGRSTVWMVVNLDPSTEEVLLADLSDLGLLRQASDIRQVRDAPGVIRCEVRHVWELERAQLVEHADDAYEALLTLIDESDYAEDFKVLARRKVGKELVNILNVDE